MVSEHADPTAVLGQADAGGQNVYVAHLSAALARRGHTVTVYTRKECATAASRTRLWPGVTVLRVKAGPLRTIPKDGLLPHMGEFGDALRKLWRDAPPDVAHAHFWMSGIASLRGAPGAGVPVAQTFHALGTVKRRFQGAADPSPPSRIRHEIRIGQRCDQVIATCSDEVAELTRMGISAERISVVPCGVSAREFTPEGAAEPRTGRVRLLTLGRLVPRKGVDTVIEALAGLPDTELLVAGGPPRARLAQDPEASRLAEIAAERGMSGRVIFTGGVPHDRIPRLIRSADIVVCTPWYEPFGIVPLEAMACGVPVIASAVGGLTDTVVHGETGLHVPPRNPGSVADAARTLLADAALRAQFGRAGVRRVRRWYDWDRVAAQTEAVYTRLLPASRPLIAGPLVTSGGSA
jgi:glycosyltransferase involved in cell wall biosynthesis